jgi:Asp-tRNA(Asn)/Glu-tRNA(Gln) amidotransferase B subunit
MTIFETIKADVLQARKDRDQAKVNVLNTLIAELCRETKEPNDDQVGKGVRKFLKNLDANIQALASVKMSSPELEREVQIVSAYSQQTDMVDFQPVCDILIAGNPEKILSEKTIGWFVGQTMKSVGGKANPSSIKTYLESKINE